MFGLAPRDQDAAWNIARLFVQVCPGVFKNSDAAYILSYSVIMLNTDQHNKQVVISLMTTPVASDCHCCT